MFRALVSMSLVAAAVALPVSAEADERGESHGSTTATPSAVLPVEGVLPALTGALEWLNSAPLTPTELRGKVVVVDFWTYTCINWLRTLPYLRAWADTYKDQGLVVIGVHAPEFEFEKKSSNVRNAAKALGVDYPIAVDSDHAIWRAFNNEYWPALYIVDAEGNIRHHRFGEGGYAQSESVIRQLLAEAGHPPSERAPTPVDPRERTLAADWTHLKATETYLGSGRGERFASPGGAAVGRDKAYAVPARLRPDSWALAGQWNVHSEFATNTARGAHIAYRFHARDAHLVMGPRSGAAPVRFRVLLDGQPPGKDHGLDVDEQGYGTAPEQRLYQLIRQLGPVDDRQLDVELLDEGVEAYAFTFG